MSVYRAIIAYRTHTDRDTCPLGLTARLLWANLASRADWDGTCSVSIATLRMALGTVNRATVKRATAELVEYGVIDVVVAHGRGRQNTYRLELAPETNGAPVRRIRERNGALVHGNGAPDASYRGEVVREVEESARAIRRPTQLPAITIAEVRGMHPDAVVWHDGRYVHAETLVAAWAK